MTKKAHVGVVPGLKEFLAEFTYKKAMGSRGYLTDIGLVPLASDKYKVTRTADKRLSYNKPQVKLLINRKKADYSAFFLFSILSLNI